MNSTKWKTAQNEKKHAITVSRTVRIQMLRGLVQESIQTAPSHLAQKGEDGDHRIQGKG